MDLLSFSLLSPPFIRYLVEQKRARIYENVHQCSIVPITWIAYQQIIRIRLCRPFYSLMCCMPYLSSTPRRGQTTDERLRVFLIGISPPPGTPRAALTLRKYHYPPLSVIAFPRLQSVGLLLFVQSDLQLSEYVACRSPGDNGNVSVAGLFSCTVILTSITILVKGCRL